MAINFPSSPSLNQVYTFDNRSWRWNGEYWQSITVTTGYTGSRGQASIFKNSVPTEQDLPIPYGGDEGDGFLVEDTGFMWIWDGSSWGSLGRFTGYTGSRGAPGTSVRLIGSVATVQDLPSDGTSDGSTLLQIGDGFIVQSSGDLYVWTGSDWSNVGKIAGDAGPIGFTGSRGEDGVRGTDGYTGSQGESSFTWGPTPPENPEVGARWYDTTAGILLVYVDDGDSLQWVETNSSGFLGRTGYTGSSGLQMYGNAPVKSIIFTNKTIAENITISSEHNAGSFGPIEIADGYTITINNGGNWTIV